MKTDTLHDAALAVSIQDWRTLFSFPLWLADGKARLKQELGRRWTFDPARLPYNQAVIDLIRRERAEGRIVILCTAADTQIANAIADHLGLFDEVMASNGSLNLRGESKADALVQRFGRRGFLYIGNDATDLPVWSQAATGVIVSSNPDLIRRARACVEMTLHLPGRRLVDTLRATAKAMRPYQWCKNALCFAPVAASGILSTAAWSSSLIAALAFCFTASGIYVLNDLSDLGTDRDHPRKSSRPFASGALPVSFGLLFGPALLACGIALAWIGNCIPVLLAYVALSLAYTFYLKQLPLVDVFILAKLYSLRLLAGGVAADIRLSSWLLGFSGFLFLSLGLIKRVSELTRLQTVQSTRHGRRGYIAGDTALLQQLGCASTFASAVVLSLYVQSSAADLAFQYPDILWGAVPLLLFWQCRLWLATARGSMHDDPIIYAARDLVSWATFGCLALFALASRFGFGS